MKQEFKDFLWNNNHLIDIDKVYALFNVFLKKIEPDRFEEISNNELTFYTMFESFISQFEEIRGLYIHKEELNDKQKEFFKL